MTRKELRDLKRWSARVTKGQADSAMFLSIWSDSMVADPSGDPVPIFQLGYAMILDKPIVIIAPQGSRIPENVRRAARAIEFYEAGDVPSMHAATVRALKAAGVEAIH